MNPQYPQKPSPFASGFFGSLGAIGGFLACCIDVPILLLFLFLFVLTAGGRQDEKPKKSTSGNRDDRHAKL